MFDDNTQGGPLFISPLESATYEPDMAELRRLVRQDSQLVREKLAGLDRALVSWSSSEKRRGALYRLSEMRKLHGQLLRSFYDDCLFAVRPIALALRPLHMAAVALSGEEIRKRFVAMTADERTHALAQVAQQCNLIALWALANDPLGAELVDPGTLSLIRREVLAGQGRSSLVQVAEDALQVLKAACGRCDTIERIHMDDARAHGLEVEAMDPWAKIYAEPAAETLRAVL